MTIQNRTGEVMRARGVRPQQLAREAKISHNTALALYRGVTTRLDLPVLDRVCAVLNVQPGELLVWRRDEAGREDHA